MATEQDTPTLLNRKLEHLGLSARAFNAIHYAGWRSKGLPFEYVETLGDLIQLTEADLFKLKNLGRKSLLEVKLVLAELGLSLRDSAMPVESALTPVRVVAMLREAKAIIGWTTERAVKLHARIDEALKEWDAKS